MKPSFQHDALFKRCLASKQNAADFLRAFLPSEVALQVDLSSIEFAKDSFVTRELREVFSDILLQCRHKNKGENIFICILIEHKSYIDKFAVFQLLTYMAQAYAKQIRNGDKLKVIVPLLFYHGQEKWNLRNVHDFFPNMGDELKQYLPFFTTCFTDLVRLADDDIKALGNEALVATLIAQKYSGSKNELVGQITTIFNTFTSTSDRNYIEALVVYILALVDVDKSKIIDITKSINNPLKQVIMTTYDLLIEEGHREGLEKGIENEKTDVVLRCVGNGLSVDIIANIADLTVSEVEKIIAKYGSL